MGCSSPIPPASLPFLNTENNDCLGCTSPHFLLISWFYYILLIFLLPRLSEALVSPQLPSPGEGWTGDSAVPGGRESHRLVKRGKTQGFLSLLQLQRMEGGGCLSVMSLGSVPKAGMWLRAESITAGSAPGLPSAQPLLWFVSSAQPGGAWRETRTSFGHCWHPTVWFGVLAHFPTLILLVCDGLSL